MKWLIVLGLALCVMILGAVIANQAAPPKPAECYEVRVLEREKGRQLYQRRLMPCPPGYVY